MKASIATAEYNPGDRVTLLCDPRRLVGTVRREVQPGRYVIDTPEYPNPFVLGAAHLQAESQEGKDEAR